MRKIWNRPNMPVWSLVTRDQDDRANMNICTYVTSVSMKPKLMLVAVYKNTKTLENLTISPKEPVLLQLLTESLAPVVRICGQQSGMVIDKISRLSKRYDLALDGQLPYFTRAAGYMVLHNQIVSEIAGDHVLYTFSVAYHKTISSESVLTTDFLREYKLIR